MLEQADIVTLHCPLMDATRHINKSTPDRMKPGAMLVNSSRGGLIDTDGVIAALQSRKLGALAIDVYEHEGALFYHDRSSDIIGGDVFQRLMTFPNVLVSEHQGFFTEADVDCGGYAGMRQQASLESWGPAYHFLSAAKRCALHTP